MTSVASHVLYNCKWLTFAPPQCSRKIKLCCLCVHYRSVYLLTSDDVCYFNSGMKCKEALPTFSFSMTFLEVNEWTWKVLYELQKVQFLVLLVLKRSDALMPHATLGNWKEEFLRLLFVRARTAFFRSISS